MQNQKPQKSKLKALAGGIISLGIFASFFAFDGGFFAAEKLGADVAETATAEPAITAIEPGSGAVGDAVSIVVADLENLTRGTGGVFFGEIPAEIETVDTAADGTITIFVRVPEVTEIGNYPIKVTTPSELVTSEIEFEVTELSELAPAPDTTTETPEENPLEEVENEPTEILPEEIVEDEPAAVTPPATEIFTAAPIFVGMPPSNLVATSTSNGVALEWSGNTEKYRIYYGTTSGKYIHRVETTGTFALLNSNFVNGTRYFFVVSAVNADGAESSGSNEVAAIYSQYAPPASANLRFASSQPTKLSEQGPAETLAVSIFVALVLSGIFFRRKIFARN